MGHDAGYSASVQETLFLVDQHGFQPLWLLEIESEAFCFRLEDSDVDVEMPQISLHAPSGPA